MEEERWATAWKLLKAAAQLLTLPLSLGGWEMSHRFNGALCVPADRHTKWPRRKKRSECTKLICHFSITVRRLPIVRKVDGRESLLPLLLLRLAVASEGLSEAQTRWEKELTQWQHKAFRAESKGVPLAFLTLCISHRRGCTHQRTKCRAGAHSFHLRRVPTTRSYRFGDCFSGSCYFSIHTTVVAWAAWQLYFCPPAWRNLEESRALDTV